MVDVKKNIEAVRARIEAACKKAGRDPKGVILLAATKDVPVSLIEEALNAGITHIGENRVQEAQDKALVLKELYPSVKWHMIGHLQTNKVGRALEVFDVIESVDSERVANEISTKLQDPSSKTQAPRPKYQVFIEVNLSGEEQKFGVAEGDVAGLLKHISSLGNIAVAGLMTVPPYFDDQELARPYFKKLKALADSLRAFKFPNVDLKYLSMGMTNDFSVAIEEGSDIIRIGRGIFGIEHKH
jgi:pyridoxal phosphate enzyme (YggS family)